MRVLHVTTHMNMGGIARYILSLAVSLKRKGVESIVTSSGGNLTRELERGGVRHVPLDLKTKFEFSPKVIASIGRLVNIMRDEKIDIVHAHTRVSQAASFFATHFVPAKYVTTCHGFFKPRLGRLLFDFWGDKVIAISAAVKWNLINDFRVKPERVELVYNGVDVEKFSKEYTEEELSAIRSRLGLAAGDIAVGTIGRLSSVKGLQFFVEALRKVLDKGYKVKGIIIGDGPEEKTLKALVTDYGIEGSMIFVESVSDTAPYLKLMDIFVFPSLREGLGLSLLEAMAAQRPCIASRTGGIQDVVNDGENGILFDVGDIDAFTGSILRLIDDEALRLSLGRAGRIMVQGRFSIDTMCDNIMDLYRKVLYQDAS